MLVRVHRAQLIDELRRLNQELSVLLSEVPGFLDLVDLLLDYRLNFGLDVLFELLAVLLKLLGF